ncbi:MAG: ferredoxin-NADP reductase [Candidatus Azotimanducaceae bacterium]|jgi:ferredoxin-NADP reductase/predicted pyridoxine 5'-phosphate oxidase superfamily flavin-nucleotide-binding protein
MNTESSPFHQGEQTVQSRMGVREQAEFLGRRTIRDHMPQQHQDFYQALPYLLVGHVDAAGDPWASWLSHQAQPDDAAVMDVEDAQKFSLSLDAVHPMDPLRQALDRPTAVGLLGIDLSNRRRNRMSAVLDGGLPERVGKRPERIKAIVRQAFGNCPQYIQTRVVKTRKNWSVEDSTAQSLSALSAAEIALIEASDSFYIASYFDDGSGGGETGADVSHRGGQPGFVRVDDNMTLTIPDFPGNNHFNTLGNIESNGKAGLLFADFASGDLLMLTGDAEVLWDSEETSYFEGAERLWRFKLKSGIRLNNALGIKFEFEQYSPNSLLTGNWAQAKAAEAAEAEQLTWLPYSVERVIEETGQVKSFELMPPVGLVPKFEAGQFLTLRFRIDDEYQVRTYTVSSAPSDARLRISVKRDGVISSYLHDHVSPNMNIEARAPSGNFVLNKDKPSVFVAAGIGITPMISMIRESLFHGIKHRRAQSMVLFYQVRDESQLAFHQELTDLQAVLGDELRVITLFSGAPDHHLASYGGYLNRDILNAELALDDYQFYVCGPTDFMQKAYDSIRSVGVIDSKISAEAFGPASLQRDLDVSTQISVVTADHAVVEFVPSSVEQGWSPQDGSLLDFAEAHGMTPASGCRAGHCGSCATGVLSGEVVYTQSPTYPVGEDEALICCAVPAKGMESEPLRLDL